MLSELLFGTFSLEYSNPDKLGLCLKHLVENLCFQNLFFICSEENLVLACRGSLWSHSPYTEYLNSYIFLFLLDRSTWLCYLSSALLLKLRYQSSYGVVEGICSWLACLSNFFYGKSQGNSHLILKILYFLRCTFLSVWDDKWRKNHSGVMFPIAVLKACAVLPDTGTEDTTLCLDNGWPKGTHSRPKRNEFHFKCYCYSQRNIPRCRTEFHFPKGVKCPNHSFVIDFLSYIALIIFLAVCPLGQLFLASTVHHGPDRKGIRKGHYVWNLAFTRRVNFSWLSSYVLYFYTQLSRVVGSGFETVSLLEQGIIRQLLQQLEHKHNVISEVRTSNVILKAQKKKHVAVEYTCFSVCWVHW